MTRPEYDTATFYLSNWSKHILRECERRRITVYDLKRKRATRNEVESVITSKNPTFLILNGHGGEKSIYGDENEPIIDLSNVKLLNKKLIYTIACKAAKKLGRIAVKNDAKCFIGYEEDFVFIINLRKVSKPLKDEFARPFFVSTNKIPISLIKGNSAKESVKRAVNEFRKWIIRVRNYSTPEADWILRGLLWDITFLKLLGNEKAKI